LYEVENQTPNGNSNERNGQIEINKGFGIYSIP
jgi:hypothetical protein